MQFYQYYESPIGWLKVTADEVNLLEVQLLKGEKAGTDKTNQITKMTIDQLKAYFKGELKTFRLPVVFQGTEFEVKVQETLATVSYGKTVSYSEIAKLIGRPGSERAIGNALNKNPYMIVNPCHRVILASGRLGGYQPGPDVKLQLLQHEIPGRDFQ